jgi:hypothetical protein
MKYFIHLAVFVIKLNVIDVSALFGGWSLMDAEWTVRYKTNFLLTSLHTI